MDKAAKCGMVLMGVLIVISIFMALTSCTPVDEQVPIPTGEPKATRLQMRVVNDTIIHTMELNDPGNVGGTVSAGTIIEMDCYVLYCFFPDTRMYLNRWDLEIYSPPPGQQNGSIELCPREPFTWQNQHRYGEQSVNVGGCHMPTFNFPADRSG